MSRIPVFKFNMFTIPKAIRTFSVQIMVLLFHINMDTVVGNCYLNLTGEALIEALAAKTELYCGPGTVLENGISCSPVKDKASMPYWNRCRKAFDCTNVKWLCADHEEEVAKCNATHFAICRSLDTTSMSATSSSPTVDLVTPTNESSLITEETMSTCIPGADFLHYMFGSISALEFIIILLILVFKRKDFVRSFKRVYRHQKALPLKCSSAVDKALPLKCLSAVDKIITKASQYILHGNPAGTAILIVNNKRQYIQPDIEYAKNIFEFLFGPATECIRIDATSLEHIQTEIQKIINASNKGTLNLRDGLACIIIGHGRQNKPGDGLLCKDDSFLRVTVLKSWFYGSNCPTLLEKPKLFFYLCCRGEDTEKEILYVQESGDRPAGVEAEAGARAGAGAEAEAEAEIIVCNDTSDILVSYASSHGKAAYFDENGSVYLRVLKDKLNEWGHVEDLDYILTEVNNTLSTDFDLTHKVTKKKVNQQPEFHSTLRHKFFAKYFHPDLEPNSENEEPTNPSDSTTDIPSENSSYMAIEMDNHDSGVAAADEASGSPQDNENNDAHKGRDEEGDIGEEGDKGEEEDKVEEEEQGEDEALIQGAAPSES